MLVAEKNRLPFRPIEITDREMVWRYTSVYGENSCQCVFASMFTQQDQYGEQICEYDGVLYILRSGLETETHRVYQAPMGEKLRTAYERILNDAAAYGKKAKFVTVTERHSIFLAENFPGRFEITENRDYAEYFYENQRMVSLAGGGLMTKRRCLYLFERMYGDKAVIAPITPADFPDILDCMQIWVEQGRKTIDEAMLTHSVTLVKRQLEYYEALGLRGIAVRIDGKLRGFIYGAPSSEDCVDAMIGKADRNVEHLFKKMYQEFSRMLEKEYKFVNWEEDCGSEGLRSMKLSYQPCKLMKKYLAEER